MSTRAAVLLGPGGQDPVAATHELVLAFQPTTGDLLLAGQILRSRIVQRTQNGLDSQSAPFAPYSTNGPFYFYPSGAPRSHEQRAAHTAGRYAKTGKQGKRTPLGIRYESYAAAKAAHGRSTVDLFGLQQHPHMMNAIIVKAGGMDVAPDAAPSGDAFSQNVASTHLDVGFYGDEAERARGHNDGAGHLPKRHFFDASTEDLEIMTTAMAHRMMARANSHK